MWGFVPTMPVPPEAVLRDAHGPLGQAMLRARMVGSLAEGQGNRKQGLAISLGVEVGWGRGTAQMKGP